MIKTDLETVQRAEFTYFLKYISIFHLKISIFSTPGPNPAEAEVGNPGSVNRGTLPVRQSSRGAGQTVNKGEVESHSFRLKVRPEEPTATSDVDSKRKETALQHTVLRQTRTLMTRSRDQCTTSSTTNKTQSIHTSQTLTILGMFNVRTRTYARSTAVLRLQCLFRTCTYRGCLGDGFMVGWHKHTHNNGYPTIVFTILRCCTTIRASFSNYDATSPPSIPSAKEG